MNNTDAEAVKTVVIKVGETKRLVARFLNKELKEVKVRDVVWWMPPKGCLSLVTEKFNGVDSALAVMKGLKVGETPISVKATSENDGITMEKEFDVEIKPSEATLNSIDIEELPSGPIARSK